MRRALARLLPTLVAFAAGVGCGFWWSDGGGVGLKPSDEVMPDRVEVTEKTGRRPSCGDGDVVVGQERIAVGGRTVVSVEVVTDDSAVAEPDVEAAHQRRRALRQAEREAKTRERQDFLTSLDQELLSAEQRKRHLLFLEALEVRDAARREISALRAEGKDVPSGLQARLADAESVLRADRDAERRALREAAGRAAGLSEEAVKVLGEDLDSVDAVLGL